MTEESIADSVRKCLEEFSVLKHVISPLVTDSDRKSVLEIAGEEARFKIWSGNIGAHSMGRRSLQYRLRDASHLQKQVKSLLKELYELLADAYAITTGEKVPWDHAEDDELSIGSESNSESDGVLATEMGQISQNVSDVIDCLLRLSVAIRNPAPHDRFAKSASTDASHYEPFDIQHVRSKFSEIEPFLADRLGRAISRRRQYLKYRESHHLKLSQGLQYGEPNDAESTVASSLPQHAKSAGFNVEAVDEDGVSESGATQTSLASSHEGGDKLGVPPLPREAESGPFECPFCFMIIIATSSLSWKRHVLADLRPYVCLSTECTASEMEFSRRREWISHEIQNHWKTYPCPCSCGMSLSTKSQCQDHVGRIHPGAFPKEQVNSMIDLTSIPTNMENGISCPLCKESLNSVKEYQRHTGRHQEQLALFALPSEDTGADDAQLEDEASGTQSHVSSGSTYQEIPGKEDEDGSFAVEYDQAPLEPSQDTKAQDPFVVFERAKESLTEKLLPDSEGREEWKAPIGATATKISRQVINPDALRINNERFEIRGNHLFLPRVLSPTEVQKYATTTRKLRRRRRRGHNDSIQSVSDETTTQDLLETEVPPTIRERLGTPDKELLGYEIDIEPTEQSSEDDGPVIHLTKRTSRSDDKITEDEITGKPSPTPVEGDSNKTPMEIWLEGEHQLLDVWPSHGSGMSREKHNRGGK